MTTLVVYIDFQKTDVVIEKQHRFFGKLMVLGKPMLFVTSNNCFHKKTDVVFCNILSVFVVTPIKL